ncbi:MAG: DEAD/DEAH box helicase domain protein [Parcubacteria group bacterium GW2011_GWA2_51_10]|nr:MAG: DEAD/DEAH box helicase domain protein [Parcubacteria group bacterium GW2011_GWA2_51_10]
MRIVTFDIETSNWMSDVGSYDPADLSIALVAVHDSQNDTYECFLENELPRLWKILEGTDVLVGYNSDHFDIPLLNKYYPGDLSRIKSVDLMREIYTVLGRRLRLDAVAEGTLGERKSGDGAQSLEWWKAGEIDKVKEYCKRDVELTKKIFDHALTHGNVKYRDLGKLREIKLDTSKWLQERGSALTYTLGF